MTPALVLCILLIIHTIVSKHTHAKEFTAIGEKDYHRCPSALEIENTKTDQFLDTVYLDSLCKNVVGVVKMKVSGNFYGIAEALFNKLPRLEDFEGTDMENLTEVTVGTWNLKYLDLSNNSLEKASIELMDDLLHLNLSHNQLTDETIVLTTMRPPLTLKLRTLDFSHNQLSKLDTLFPFWNLRKFILNDNQITNIKPGILQRYPNLVTLNLARNKLFKLSDGIFTALIHLMNLDLSYNELNGVNMKIINSLRSLEFLDMIGNNINEFNHDKLDHHLELLRINDYHTYIHGQRVGRKIEKSTTTELSSSAFSYAE